MINNSNILLIFLDSNGTFRKSVVDGTMPQFDAMVTFSSLEHSGLGR